MIREKLMVLSDKAVKFEKDPRTDLFRIAILDKGNEEKIPLLMEGHQVETFKEMLKEIKFDENMPSGYFKLIVSGCAKFAMRALWK